jgi:hypothetical protein
MRKLAVQPHSAGSSSSHVQAQRALNRVDAPSVLSQAMHKLRSLFPCVQLLYCGKVLKVRETPTPSHGCLPL